MRILPVVSKATYRERATDLLASDIPAYRRVRRLTSGSSGEPCAFWLDLDKMPVIRASRPFYDSWFGLGPFTRQLRVSLAATANPQLPSDTPLLFRLQHSTKKWLRDLYVRRVEERVALLQVDRDYVGRFWRRMEAFRPEVVIGYASTVAFIAGELLQRRLYPSRPLRGVITFAETLSPERRHLIQQYFKAPIINRYGLNELGCWSAQSCAVSPEQFHVNTELVIHELLAEDGSPVKPGEIGRVVLTDLFSYAMPFIRYDAGDLAVAGADACAYGRGLPLFHRLEGRSLESLRTPSGAVVSPAVLGHYLMVVRSHVDAVQHYQLVQDGPDRARLLVVPGPGFDDARRERLRDDTARLLGEGMTVRVETIREIPLESSGKRPIIKPAPVSSGEIPGEAS